jgi:hypothetical protein
MRERAVAGAQRQIEMIAAEESARSRLEVDRGDIRSRAFEIERSRYMKWIRNRLPR